VDDRASSPVVGKAMEATLVVLYVGLVTTVLYGGVVPDYRTAAGQEVAERTVSNAATEIESSVPPEAAVGVVRVEVELPATLVGETYRVYADDGRLVLDHPDPDVSTAVPLVVSDRVVAVNGTWVSGRATRISVETTESGVEVRLE
jgi:hypothetical protein